MSWILARSVGRLYLTLVAGLFFAILVVYLVGDFADRLNAYLDRPVADVAWLYWNKLLVTAHQLAPAAMLLAAGATASTLRKRGEWTAMQALGLSRAVIVLPVGLVTLALALGLVAFDEWVVSQAGPRVDRLMVEKFDRWGDFRFFYAPTQWFRVGPTLLYVRGEAEREGTVLHDVTVFELDDAFHVTRRLDGDRLEHVDGQRWRLANAQVRAFLPDGAAPVSAAAVVDLTLQGSTANTFRVRIGRPEYMRAAELLAQLSIRAGVGLPTERLRLALHNRFAYPATGFAATMLALALALRPARRGHLTLALVEGLVVTVALFALLLVGKALVLGDHLAPGVAAWAPIISLLVASGALWWRDERDGRAASARAPTPGG